MNETGSAQPARPWPRWLKALLGIGVVILLVVGTVFLLGVAATTRWRVFAAGLREQGQPLTFAEIEALRATVPEDRNGARVIERLSARLAEIKKGGVEPAVLVFGWEGGDYTILTGIPRYTLEPSRAFRDRHAGLLDELAALRDTPTGRFDIDYEPDPTQSLLPNLTPLRNAARLLYLDGILRMIDGDVAGSVNDIALQFNLANTLYDEPILISRLVQIALEALIVEEIESILRVGEIDEAQLHFLEGLVSSQLASETMKWALWGERAFFLKTCEGIGQGRLSLSSVTSGVNDPATTFPFPMLGFPWWLVRNNQLRGAEMYGWLVDAADDPRSLIDAARRIEVEMPRLGPTQILVKTMMPTLTFAMQLHVRIGAHLECVRTSLVAERFRLITGRLPNSLTELVPDYLEAVPTDPFDGQPLRMAVKESGIVIYSIGMDEIDNGGIVARNKDWKHPPDTGFRLLPLDQRGLRITDQPAPNND